MLTTYLPLVIVCLLVYPLFRLFSRAVQKLYVMTRTGEYRINMRGRVLIARDFLYVLDMLRARIAVGLSIMQAFGEAWQSAPPTWTRELSRVHTDWSCGVEFSKALHESAARMNCLDYTNFITTLTNSQIYGLPLTAVLDQLAQDIRRRRKLEAEHAARKLSVKITLPLVLCIFPSLLVVFLAPAVIRMISGEI